jgi:hypothetical protein
MNCPSCHATDIPSLGKRYALYPAGVVAIIGLPFAMVHQLSCPLDYHCGACGADFARRTAVGKIAHVGLYVLVIVFGSLFAVAAYSLFTR